MHDYDIETAMSNPNHPGDLPGYSKFFIPPPHFPNVVFFPQYR
jgi:hypothetical protein